MSGNLDPAAFVAKTPAEVEIERSQEFRRRMADRLNGKRPRPSALAPFVHTTPKVGRTTLVVGDSHANAHTPNHRYTWLGKIIREGGFDTVVDIGDWWSMDSINRFDLPGSRAFEGKRYHADIEAGIDGMERVEWETKGMRKKPRLVRTLGNHEYRIAHFLENFPRMNGLLGLHDLMSAEFGWEEHPYKRAVEIDGVLFCHEFKKGNGQYGAANVGKQEGRACVYGHTHRRQQFDVAGSLEGSRRTVVNVGCYFTHREAYAGTSNNSEWWRGLCVLRDVRDGEIGGIDWLSMDEIIRKYA